MAYDDATDQDVLFGGIKAAGNYNDTWIWTGTGWSQVDDSSDPGCTTACTSSPPARAASAMAYDQTTDQLLLFGGQSNTTSLNDTWVWNGTVWTQVDDGTDVGCTNSCTSSPPARSGMGMAYDPETGKVILFGGLGPANDTWSWSGSDWTQVDDSSDPGCTNSCTSSPPSSVAPDLAYDPASTQLVLFGGQDYEGNATWTWNGSTWLQVDDSSDPGCSNACSSSPPARSGGSIVYVPVLGELLLFGGLGPPQYNDTWVWDGTAWTQIDDGTDPGCGDGLTNPCPSSSSPPTRSVTPLTYDPASEQLILAGGQGGATYGGPFLNDTWIFAPPHTSLSITNSDNRGGNSATGSRGSVGAGSSITYTVVVTNSGSAGAGAVTIHDDLPSGITSDSWSATGSGGASSFSGSGSGSIDQTAVTLPASASLTYTIAAATASSVAGVLTDTASADSANATSVSASDSDTVGATQGYWLTGSDGGVFAFGDAHFYGSLPELGAHLDDIVSMVPTSNGGGYWLVGSDGGVFAFGDAHFYGSLPELGVHLDDIVAVVPTLGGGGYWLVGADGGVFAFGNAQYYGSLPGLGVHLSDIVGVLPSSSGAGYRLIGSDGGVFAFGNAQYYGSLPGQGMHLSDIVGATSSAAGYWLTGSDGGVFAFGDAQYDGSLPGRGMQLSDIVGAASSGAGYWLAGSDGGVFALGDGHYLGSLPGLDILNERVVAIAGNSMA